MSEVQPRPSASRGGRGVTRAGRGGLSSRGGGRAGARQSNGEEPTPLPSVPLDEQGELGQWKKQYMSQLDTLKELFPDWTDDDLVFALQETDGDLQSTIERITEGNVSRFADVKKKTKEKKPKDFTSTTETSGGAVRARGGRGGLEGGRGGRGRGSDRGRGGGRATTRAGAIAASLGRTPVASTSTTDSPAWDAAPEKATAVGGWDQPSSAEGASEGQWGAAGSSEATPAGASEVQKSSLIPQGATKSWASMLAQPLIKLVPAAAKLVETPAPEPDRTIEPEISTDQETSGHENTEQQEYPPPIDESVVSTDFGHGATDSTELQDAEDLGPGKDRLTEDNLEHLPDVSVPPATGTAASTIDAASAVGTLTRHGSSQQLPQARPPMGGYATSAWKAAAGTPGRSTSFQRIMEQREAVVMPSNHAVDRAAVQFGSMGLNGENNPVDVDEDREEPETRTQPPQQSPPAQPRASLPPAPQQQSTIQEPSMQESLPTPKQAPGLPMPIQSSTISNSLPSTSQASTGTSGHGSQPGPQYGQYGRYGGTVGQEQPAASQKDYDPFSQQLNYSQNQQDTPQGFSSHSQAPGHMQQPGQSQQGGYSQGQSEYNSQYGNDQQRSSYQNYYGSGFGQQASASQQENAPPQRSVSGFGGNESAYGSTPSAQPQSRYGETHTSGNNTPNPPGVPQQSTTSQSQQGQMPQQPQGQGSHAGGGYPYGNPYYGGGSYYGSYMNQYPNYNNYNQHGYGAPFGGKGGMYGQPHHGYGMSPQPSYEQSATPASSGGLGASTNQGRDSSFTGGLGDYGRSGSTQPSQNQQHSSSYSSFPSETPEGFGRSSATQYGGQQNEGALKPFTDPKPGASPSLGQAGRTASTTNSSAYGVNQSNYPQGQAPSQQGFGGYPSHASQLHNNHGSQYGGLGGLGGSHQGNAQSHQAGGYGNYGGGAGFGGNSYGNYGRGGWGGNYGH